MKVKCNVDGKYYALKRFISNYLDPEIDEEFKIEIFREIDHLRQLDHPNIV